MKPKSPCYECENRKVGCHSDCCEYINYQRAVETFNRTVNQAKQQCLNPVKTRKWKRGLKKK